MVKHKHETSSDEVDSKKKIPTYQFYFEQQEKYSKIYGPKTIVFFQMGKFYDAYSTKTKGYSELDRLEELLNIHYIRRNQDDEKKNPYLKPNQFGINCVSIKKNLTTMIESGYTIVLFDQTTDGETIERECVGVYTPGTFLSDRLMQDANYIMCAYISEEKQLTGNKVLMAIGVTLVDVTTGSCMVHEFYSDKMDERFGLDELVRIMQIFKPAETVIYYHPVEFDEALISKIKLYLELDKFQNHYFYVYHKAKSYNIAKSTDNSTESRTNLHKLELICEQTFKINYQNEYLSKIYELNRQLCLNKKRSALEILGLERKSYATISIMIMLKYISEHNILLLKNLSYPEIYFYHKHLVLGNNAIEQLNIIDSNSLEVYNHKYKSLFDVVNKTSTPMGRRFLKENLVNPLSQENRQIILHRYDCIEQLRNNKLTFKIREELKKIYDVERLHRRMAIGIIVPYEFYRLDIFYQYTTKIIALIKDNQILRSIIPDATIKDFAQFQIKYNKEYDFEKLQLYNNFDIDKSFFNKGIHPDLDKVQDKIDYVWSIIHATEHYLTDLVLGNNNSKNKNTKILSMVSNETDGHYLTISKTNEKHLKEALNKKKGPIKISLSVGHILEIEKNDIVFKNLKKGRTKIFIAPLVEHTIKLQEYTTKLSKLIRKIFIKSMLRYYREYKIMMHNICKFISEIDFLVSGAIVADEYYYCKPSIPSKEPIPSYFKTKGLRHAIIERLCNETAYIPNDIELGNVPEKSIENPQSNGPGSNNGVLLYGHNSVGKSSFMKAIGISIILAQIGYYVPATEFILEPYMALYARITGNDNIFKGLSSFELEMTELYAILLRTEKQGPNTIVIGDEVCRGTEDTSGISLVASTLVTLSECQCTFIFSSHLHDLPLIDEVKNLTNLRLFHLHIHHDKKNDCLVFDRKLTPGSGSRVYGLEVAKYLIKNQKFINRAEIIKKRLMNETKFDLPTKTSKYNKKLVIRCCNICRYSPASDYHKELESHHINFQKDCLADGKIKDKPYLSKNKLYNLVVLCHKCHKQVHAGEIIINGYSDTSIGPILDYTVDIKRKMLNGLDELDLLENKPKGSIDKSLSK